MSTTAEVPAEKPLFTAKEEETLKKAWLCLRTGAPDIDVKKLVKLGVFNTEKTASNTWGVIKKKLLTLVDENEGFNTAAATTTAVKRTKKTADSDGDADADADANANATTTPASKKRTKKKMVDAEVDAETGEARAKKKRKSPAKSTKKVESKSTESDQDAKQESINQEAVTEDNMDNMMVEPADDAFEVTPTFTAVNA